MARTYADAGKLYRAVVVITAPDAKPRTVIYGPYSAKGAATAQIGRVVRRWERWSTRHDSHAGTTAAGWVEATAPVWYPLDDS